MQTATGFNFRRRKNSLVHSSEKQIGTVGTFRNVDVEYNDPGDLPGCDTDIRVGPLLPPSIYLSFVFARIEAAVFRARMFPLAFARLISTSTKTISGNAV